MIYVLESKYVECILPKYCQFDWFVRLGLFITLQFDFIILPRFELWVFAACFTHVAILYPSLTGIT